MLDGTYQSPKVRKLRREREHHLMRQRVHLIAGARREGPLEGEAANIERVRYVFAKRIPALVAPTVVLTVR